MSFSVEASEQPIRDTMMSDERREWVRIDDRLLLEYRLVSESPDTFLPPDLCATEAMIAESIAKPTVDLLSRADDVLNGSPVVPWLRKIDWLLELTLKTLAKMNPGGIPIAQVTDVNISGGGIGFTTKRELQAGQDLAIKLILPPFRPIQAIVHIIRVTPHRETEAGFQVATQFTTMSPDDQESIIRYILLTQAERLRARRSFAG